MNSIFERLKILAYTNLSENKIKLEGICTQQLIWHRTLKNYLCFKYKTMNFQPTEPTETGNGSSEVFPGPSPASQTEALMWSWDCEKAETHTSR